MIKKTFDCLTNVQKHEHINALEKVNEKQSELIRNFISLLTRLETNVNLKNNMIDLLIKEKKNDNKRRL